MKREPGKFLKILPSLITCIRIAGSIALVHLSVAEHTIAFYIIYGCCGLTDFLDGLIARTTHTCSKVGSRLDSVADILFLGTMAYKFIPICLDRLNFVHWILVGLPALIHLSAYIVCFFRFHVMSALHTYANKVMSALIFLFPFTLIGDFAPLYTWYVYIGSAFALYSAIECLLIHCISKRYNPKNQSMWLIGRNERIYRSEHPEEFEIKEYKR